MLRRILIAEDHSLIRSSIQTIFLTEGITEMDEVQTCRDLQKTLKLVQYTHLILDITLADGNSLGLLQNIFEEYPDLKVLVYSSQPSRIYDEFLRLRYGMRYICKTEGRPETVQKLLAFLKNTKLNIDQQADSGTTPFTELTLRELQVLSYLLEGLSPADISTKLGIDPVTVRVHKKGLLGKTNTKNILELRDLATLHHLYM